jgi:hypothetical protein
MNEESPKSLEQRTAEAEAMWNAGVDGRSQENKYVAACRHYVGLSIEDFAAALSQNRGLKLTAMDVGILETYAQNVIDSKLQTKHLKNTIGAFERSVGIPPEKTWFDRPKERVFDMAILHRTGR